MLYKLGDLIERDAEILAKIESIDNGKAVSMAAAADVPMAAGCLRYYGGWADKIEGKVIDTNAETFAYTRAEPVSIHSNNLSVFTDTSLAWCLRSNHPMELPTSHVGMEDRSSRGYW